jgi:hypothetical protein
LQYFVNTDAIVWHLGSYDAYPNQNPATIMLAHKPTRAKKSRTIFMAIPLKIPHWATKYLYGP